MQKRTTLIGIIGFLLVSMVLPAQAQPQHPQRRKTPFQGSPLGWNIDAVLDMYVQNISRHYDLNEAQAKYTRALLTKRSKEFLQNYEADVRELFSEYMTYQMGQSLPAPEIAMEFAQRAEPLTKAIRRQVIEGNEEWREILNEEQKRKHDRDMAVVREMFDKLETQLDHWKDGKVYSSEVGRRKISKRPIQPMKSENRWEHYVRSFIRMYHLNADQQQTAFSVLRSMMERADSYRQSKRKEFAELEQRYDRLEELFTRHGSSKHESYRVQARKAYQEQLRLEAPIRKMFQDLKEKLMRIPTAEQKRARAEHQKKLEQMIAERKGGSQTKPAATTQPAKAAKATTTQPKG